MVMNDKPIRIVNIEAVRLAKLRAACEGRSAANAASQTIIEALSKKQNKSREANDTNDKAIVSRKNQDDKS
jgi:hypothetical protein